MKPVIGLNVDVNVQNPLDVKVGRRYIEAITKAGGVPLLLPPVTDDDDLDRLLSLVNGVVLIGGLDYSPLLYGEAQDPTVKTLHPDREKFDLRLIDKLLQGKGKRKKKKKPLLPICGGLQLLNIALGGTLFQDLETKQAGLGDTHRPKAKDATTPSTAARDYPHHPVNLVDGTRLSKIFGTPTLKPVLSSHHQAVNRLGEGLVVNARADDGVVEGIELTNHPFAVAVQWHPEAHPEDSMPLFQALIRASAA